MRSKFFKNSIVKAILICFILYFILGVFNLFFYEANDEPAFENMLRGVYWNTPINDFYFYLRGIANVLSSLYYKSWIQVNYFGIMLIGLSFMAHVLICSVILNIKSRFSYLFCGLFLIVSFYNIYFVSFTRVSILLSFSSLFVFIDYWLKDKEIIDDKNLWNIRLFKNIFVNSILFLCFLIAYLLRPQGGILGFVVALSFVLLYLSECQFKRIITVILGMILFLFLSYSAEKLITNKTDSIAQQEMNVFAKHTRSVVDYRQVVKTISEEQETLIYEIKNFFYIDVNTIDPKKIQFLENNKQTIFQQLWSKKDQLVVIISNMSSKLLLSLIILLSLVLSILTYRINWKKSVLYGSTILFVLLLSIVISVVYKFEYRVFVPIITVITIIGIFLMNERKMNSALPSKYFIFFFSIAILIQFFLYFKSINKHIENRKIEYNDLSYFNSHYHGKFIFTAAHFGVNYNPLLSFRWDSTKTIVPMSGWNSYNRMNMRFLKEKIGSTDFVDLIRWIEKTDNAYILSDDKWNTILKTIFNFHHIKVDLIPFDIYNRANNKGLYKVIVKD